MDLSKPISDLFIPGEYAFAKTIREYYCGNETEFDKFKQIPECDCKVDSPLPSVSSMMTKDPVPHKGDWSALSQYDYAQEEIEFHAQQLGSCSTYQSTKTYRLAMESVATAYDDVPPRNLKYGAYVIVPDTIKKIKFIVPGAVPSDHWPFEHPWFDMPRYASYSDAFSNDKGEWVSEYGSPFSWAEIASLTQTLCVLYVEVGKAPFTRSFPLDGYQSANMLLPNIIREVVHAFDAQGIAIDLIGHSFGAMIANIEPSVYKDYPIVNTFLLANALTNGLNSLISQFWSIFPDYITYDFFVQLFSLNSVGIPNGNADALINSLSGKWNVTDLLSIQGLACFDYLNRWERIRCFLNTPPQDLLVKDMKISKADFFTFTSIQINPCTASKAFVMIGSEQDSIVSFSEQSLARDILTHMGHKIEWYTEIHPLLHDYVENMTLSDPITNETYTYFHAQSIPMALYFDCL